MRNLILMSFLFAGIACSLGQIGDEPYLQSGDRVAPNTMVVRWFTSQDLDSWVDYGLTPEYGYTAGQSDQIKEHEVVLTDLKEDTVYHYRVRSGPYTSVDGTFQTFTIAPEKKFVFVAYGDNRSNPVGHESVIKAILLAEVRPSFILNVGDIVANGENRKEWHRDAYWPSDLRGDERCGIIRTK